MNKTQYVNSILKKILATDRTKKRIRADLMTEIEALEDQGLSLEEIIHQKGSPALVAKEFNDGNSDPEARRQYYLQKGLKTAAMILLISAALLIFAGTAFQYLPFWLTPFLTDGESVAIIGGADGPTSIFVTSQLNTTPFAAWLLTLGCGLLILCLAALAIYWVLRKKS